ncbi:hypothetical protein A2738_01730 [Candidatus Nomurabacteria bacterium RIFCSPHIGHO2_01_FULL_42_15]|uniref:riboflavin kinase n=1 Tax=Candidatus Nomurabacteria bacterium RIFCSPHIGHO2_01_FULL_42_15 TaxID=1801742 RepID=A0A1F6VG33_9BACT|nr:MAG: hypothetical protein A2738_01730 [Candidatus Nomurabacteria bacterium RIFCSPHIGHO2_01_FULL_42_15]OGI92994.1 MAG: hypothetical protein A3A99_00440 [Candidatus Nomurabacteria bacterium RIFCSPLOWO2_01_FULL_41_18]
MNYIIKGIVIIGDGYGRKIGFPTVNLETEQEGIYAEGVYSGSAILDGKKYKAGIVIGPKIESKNKVEAHLIGYSGDAYGKEVTLETKSFLREYKKFYTESELIAQIKEDLKLC